MSGTGEEDRAGLYVLGALNAEEMRAVRIAAGRDDGLAAEIAAWERRLAPLTSLVDPIEPPATLWTQLDARLARITGAPNPVGEIYRPPQTQKSRRRGGSERALAVWRGAALGAMALAAGLAVALLLREPPPKTELAMLLPAKPGAGGWLLQVLPGGEIRAEAQGALPKDLNQDYELWALPENSQHPLPLGILPDTGNAVLKTASVPHTNYQLLVSLEQKGGSPTGIPTLPVLYQGVPLTR
jgi:anti-sigma-K factor RskA